jgi:membrane protease YdiL (CAAX protease family)
MNEPEPGTLPPPLPPQPPPSVSASRWGLQVLILALYPILLGIAAAADPNRQESPLLQAEVPVLIMSIGLELGFFAVVFLLAWSMTRPTPSQFYFCPEQPRLAIGRAFLFSIGLRVFVGLAALVGAGLLLAFSGGGEDSLDQFRPRTESIVDAQAMVQQPLYFWINFTLVSFVMGGFREELWRAGMFCGLQGLLPKLTSTPTGKGLMVLAAALAFGIGHLPQGPGGVFMTTILGIGLGVIMVWRRSFWETALAHGFFDATSFALLNLLARFHPEWLPG